MNVARVMKKLFCFLAMVALGLSACNNKETPDNNTESPAQVYHFSIPASFGTGTPDTRAVSFDGTTSSSTFATTERVHIYNSTKATMLSGYLSPTNLSNDNQNCDLTGDLTGTIDEADELWLLYNIDENGEISYDNQNGLASGVRDGAKAIVTVNTTSPLTTSDAHFTNLQSVFRFKFVDEGGNPISVRTLTLYSTNGGTITRSFNAKQNTYETNRIHINRFPSSKDYLYAGVCFNPNHVADGNKMVFLADNGSHLYRGKKAEPASGFTNGKYYYNTNPIQLTDEGEKQYPDVDGDTSLIDEDYFEIESGTEYVGISSISFGYRFIVTHSNPTLFFLPGLTATRFEDSFIHSDYPVTLDLYGANSISCQDNDRCVCSLQDLKLQGNGTLTVTSNDAANCGLYGSNYTSSDNHHEITTALDVSSLLAANGYKVTRSARTDNHDGSYSWTYTVSGLPNTFRVNSIGKLVYFSPGNLQYNQNEATYKWRFAEHQYDCVKAWNTSTWVDLFGWGCWTGDSPAPIKTSEDQDSYSWDDKDFAKENLLADESQRSYDWWTLSGAEWEYLIAYHTYVQATINTDDSQTFNGIVFLPKTWEGPTVNTSLKSYEDNVFNSTQWGVMEAAGAIFFPIAGRRQGTEVSNNRFDYATSEKDRCVIFSLKGLSVPYTTSCYCGRAVRLVRNAN